jgi:hypothetical protein
MELQAKNDKSFMDSIYKLMRDMLDYKPPITKEQFFTIGFIEVKALMACEIITAIQKKFKLTAFKPTQLAGVSQSKINDKIKQPNTRLTTTGLPGKVFSSPILS